MELVVAVVDAFSTTDGKVSWARIAGFVLGTVALGIAVWVVVIVTSSDPR